MWNQQKIHLKSGDKGCYVRGVEEEVKKSNSMMIRREIIRREVGEQGGRGSVRRALKRFEKTRGNQQYYRRTLLCIYITNLYIDVDMHCRV